MHTEPFEHSIGHGTRKSVIFFWNFYSKDYGIFGLSDQTDGEASKFSQMYLLGLSGYELEKLPPSCLVQEGEHCHPNFISNVVTFKTEGNDFRPGGYILNNGRVWLPF